MIARIVAFLIWTAWAAGLTYWALRWFDKPLPAPGDSVSVSMLSTPRNSVVRLLAAPAASASQNQTTATDQSGLAERIQLIGLMAATGSSGLGVALLTIDSKPTKAFRVGQTVDGTYVVLAITHKGVDIGLPNSTAAISLAIQGLPPAAAGTVPNGQPVETEQSTPEQTPNDTTLNKYNPQEDGAIPAQNDPAPAMGNPWRTRNNPVS